MPRARSYLSTRELRVAVTADTDPTADSVHFAFTEYGGDPEPSDWVTGGWKTPPLNTGEWVAFVVVGPLGATRLTRGEWTVWVRVTDSTTQPVEPVNVITIT